MLTPGTLFMMLTAALVRLMGRLNRMSCDSPLSVDELLVSTTTLSKELTALIRQSREDLAPALAHLENVVAVLNKNEDNLDSSLRLMAPFYRVFANTLGTGPWFDTWIANFPPVPQVG